MFQESIRQQTPEAEVTIVELQGPAGPAVQLESGIYGAFMISAKLDEKVKRILDYFEYTNTHEFFELIYYGVEGVHYEVDGNGNKVMTELGATELGHLFNSHFH